MNLIAITLGKDWLDYKAGDTVHVDPERADWLRANGYEANAKDSSPTKAEGKTVKGKRNV